MLKRTDRKLFFSAISKSSKVLTEQKQRGTQTRLMILTVDHPDSLKRTFLYST